MENRLKPFEILPLSGQLIADLRSDHAGECGAVAIYTGILAVSGNEAVRRFAEAHRKAEQVHREFFAEWMPRQHRSRLLPLWTAAGWLLGAVSALFGPQAVYRTISAVETFVEQHYTEQIEKMEGEPQLAELAAKLRQFCEEEVEHRDDAADRLGDHVGHAARLWILVVGTGSSLGVAIARKI
jgi:ubiquinone biosynthesis monooxygenase Coq7